MTTTMMMTNEEHVNTHEELKQICVILTEYATALLSAGATSTRIESCVGRIARCYGVHSEVSILPRRVLLMVWNSDMEHSYNQVGSTQRDEINLYTVAKLSSLSYDLERCSKETSEGKPDIVQFKRLIEEILNTPRMQEWVVILLTGLANLSFCRLFEGDWTAMAIVFVATISGNYLKNYLAHSGIDKRLAIICGSFVSSIIAMTGFLYDISDTPVTALATSVLWLVPGIRFINGINDMLCGHHTCALSRLAEAAITTICLSLGLVLSIFIMNL